MKRRLSFTVPLVCALLLGVLWYVETLGSAPVAQPWETATASLQQTLPRGLLAERVQELSGQTQTLEGIKQQLETSKTPTSSLTKESKDSVKMLAELRAAIDTSQPQLADLERLFPILNDHWRGQVARAEASAKVKPDFSHIPVLPPFAEELYSGTAQTTEAHKYLVLYRLTYDLSVKARQEAVDAWKADIAGEFSELLRWHRLRSAYLTELVRLGAPDIVSWTPENFATMQFEAGLIPYRFSVLGVVKETQVEQGVGHGLTGWLLLLRGATRLLLAALGPLVAFLLLTRLVSFLRRLIQRVDTESALARWAPLFLSLLPWLGLFGVLRYEEQVLTTNELLLELSIVPAVGQFYALYRILSIVFRALLNYSLRGVPPEERLRLARKVRITSSVAAAFVALVALARYALYVSIGRGLLYWTMTAALPWGAALLFYVWSATWRQDLPFLTEAIYGRAVRRKLTPLSEGLQGLVVAPFVLAVVLVGMFAKSLSKLAIRFEWFNRLLAGVLRQRLGTASLGASKVELPSAYLDAYHAAGHSAARDWDGGRQSFRESLEETIQAWLEGVRGGEFVIVSGARGSGRSAVLGELSERFGESLEVVRIDIPAKTLHESDLANCLGQPLGVDPSDCQSLSQLVEQLQNRHQTLILVEDAQNIFLAQVGGFEAFLALGRFLRLNRCLFCLSFDREAWNYLDSAFLGQVITPEVYELPKWSAEALRKLILSRHRATGFVLRYDDSLLKTTLDPDDLPNVERAFFHLLWDQSDGNPGIAEALWFESLSPILGEELTLRVGPPPAIRAEVLDRLNDNSLFLLAALLRHDSLSAEEAEAVTALPKGFVQTAFNHGLESGLLERTASDRIRVQLFWTIPLTRHLRRRNFLYG